MKSLMSVLVVLPTLLATAAVCRAQTAGVPTLKPVLSRVGGYPCGDRHPIERVDAASDRMPYGPDVPCPDFPDPEPLPYPKPHPRPEIDQEVKRTSVEGMIEKAAAVLNGAKAGDHAAVLSRMFDGSVAGGESGAAAVFAVNAGGRFAHMGPSTRDPLERPNKNGLPKLVPVSCTDKDGCQSEIGKSIMDFVDAVAKPIEEYIEHHDYTEDAKKQYGGCRMDGTCEK